MVSTLLELKWNKVSKDGLSKAYAVSHCSTAQTIQTSFFYCLLTNVLRSMNCFLCQWVETAHCDARHSLCSSLREHSLGFIFSQ